MLVAHLPFGRRRLRAERFRLCVAPAPPVALRLLPQRARREAPVRRPSGGRRSPLARACARIRRAGDLETGIRILMLGFCRRDIIKGFPEDYRF
jgi:hypothetical protein